MIKDKKISPRKLHIFLFSSATLLMLKGVESRGSIVRRTSNLLYQVAESASSAGSLYKPRHSGPASKIIASSNTNVIIPNLENSNSKYDKVNEQIKKHIKDLCPNT